MRTKINDSLHTGIECELDEQLPRAKVDGKDVEVYMVFTDSHGGIVFQF